MNYWAIWLVHESKRERKKYSGKKHVVMFNNDRLPLLLSFLFTFVLFFLFYSLFIFFLKNTEPYKKSSSIITCNIYVLTSLAKYIVFSCLCISFGGIIFRFFLYCVWLLLMMTMIIMMTKIIMMRIINISVVWLVCWFLCIIVIIIIIFDRFVSFYFTTIPHYPHSHHHDHIKKMNCLHLLLSSGFVGQTTSCKRKYPSNITVSHIIKHTCITF